MNLEPSGLEFRPVHKYYIDLIGYHDLTATDCSQATTAYRQLFCDGYVTVISGGRLRLTEKGEALRSASDHS